MLGFALRLFASLFVVFFRRLFRGRRRPSWTLLQEAALRAMEMNARAVVRMDAARARAAMAKLATPRPLGRDAIRSERVVGDDLEGEWFAPREGATSGVLLFIHGGAYVFGSVDTYRDLVHRLTLATGGRTLAIETRLAPEHPFPAAIEDCVNAFRWLVAQGHEPARIVLAGDSSGGALAIATMLELRDAGETLPAGAALLSPWVDLESSGETIETHEVTSWGDRDYLLRWTRDYLQDTDPRTPLASPVHADLEGLPPLLVQVGACELLLSEIETFVERARLAGVEVQLTQYADMVHGFQLMASLFPQGEAAIAEVGRFVNACWGGAVNPSIAARKTGA